MSITAKVQGVRFGTSDIKGPFMSYLLSLLVVLCLRRKQEGTCAERGSRTDCGDIIGEWEC